MYFAIILGNLFVLTASTVKYMSNVSKAKNSRRQAFILCLYILENLQLLANCGAVNILAFKKPQYSKILAAEPRASHYLPSPTRQGLHTTGTYHGYSCSLPSSLDTSLNFSG